MSARPSVHNVVLTRLENNAAEDTIEMARQVQATLDTPGWAFVQDFLNQMIEDADVAMERGVHEQAVYAAFVAEKRALRTSQVVADAIVEGGRRAEQSLHEMAAGLAAGDTP